MMKIKSLCMKWLMPVLLLNLVFASNAIAQDSKSEQKTVRVSEAFIIEAEKVAIERDHLKRQLEIRDEQLKVKDETIAALNALASIERARADSLLKAVTDYKAAIQVDDKVFRSFESSIADYKLERQRLITERDKAISSRTRWTIGGLVLGLAVGIASQR